MMEPSLSPAVTLSVTVLPKVTVPVVTCTLPTTGAMLINASILIDITFVIDILPLSSVARALSSIRPTLERLVGTFRR